MQRRWNSWAPVASVGLVVAVLTSVRPGAVSAVQTRGSGPGASIPYFIADGTGIGGFRPSDRELAQWALDSWERSGDGAFRFTGSEESRALVRVYWAGPRDGQYGEMRPLDVDGRRGAAVFIRPDMEALGPDIAVRAARDELLRDAIVYLTCLHELGHALGLAHTADFRDIMYFFGYGGDIGEYFDRYRRRLGRRADIAGVSGLSAQDVARLRKAFAPR